jgi:hypothetical protein
MIRLLDKYFTAVADIEATGRRKDALALEIVVDVGFLIFLPVDW